MATKTLKAQFFPISTPEDLNTLADFLSNVKSIEFIVQADGKVLVIFEE